MIDAFDHKADSDRPQDRSWSDGKIFIPSMIAGTLAVIGCDSLLFYARISLDKDLSC